MGEVRVTFNKDEEALENFVKSKSSGAGYLKDLARLEMKKEEMYINSSNIDVELIAKLLAEKIGNQTITKNANNNNELKKFDIEDLDISDLD